MNSDSSQENVNHWLTSVTSILDNVTSLKVSTAIVSEIKEESFLPWEAYQDIYTISRSSLQEAQINSELWDSYLNLRRQLELKYALRAINPNCPFYNSAAKDQIIQNLPVMQKANDSSWESLPSQLPSPFASPSTAENKLLAQILADKPLLTLLHQLARSKVNLDLHHNLETNLTDIANQDITYVQTVINLDSQISNRYAQEILHHPDKDAILLLHQKGVESAEKQWFRLLKFAVDLVNKSKKEKPNS